MNKDLESKGVTNGSKVGAKVRNSRLVDGSCGHAIDCKIDGIGPMQIKPEVVKKA